MIYLVQHNTPITICLWKCSCFSLYSGVSFVTFKWLYFSRCNLWICVVLSLFFCSIQLNLGNISNIIYFDTTLSPWPGEHGRTHEDASLLQSTTKHFCKLVWIKASAKCCSNKKQYMSIIHTKKCNNPYTFYDLMLIKLMFIVVLFYITNIHSILM